MYAHKIAVKAADAGSDASAGDPLRHKLADAELEDQVWAFLPPSARSVWQSTPKRMVTSEAQVLPHLQDPEP